MKIKLGFDIHGVLDTHYKQYAKMIQALDRNIFEIHIVTGVKEERGLRENPELIGLDYDSWFSIHEECEVLGVDIQLDEDDKPHVDADIWDVQKAIYCEREGLFALYDDSPTYHKHFTGECLYLRQMNNELSVDDWRNNG